MANEKYTWVKEQSGKVATRIDNKTKRIEYFRKDKDSGEWRSLNYPYKPQPKSVQKKAAMIASKKKGYNVDKGFKVLGRKNPKRKTKSKR
jgi:hypothetical protein